MLKNYFKIAIAVLRRRKFFTFISLFGISFTLTILIVMAAFVDKVATDNYPDRKRDRSLYISSLEESGRKKGNSSSGPPSYYFLSHFGGSLRKPVAMTIFSGNYSTNTYLNNRKVSINYKFTDAAYWTVLEHEFIEGKAFTRQQVDNRDPVAVITEDMKRAYFGEVPSVVGQTIEVDDVKYRVTGVIKNIAATTYIFYEDVYLPYTLSKANYKDRGYLGGYMAILLARSGSDVGAMQQEWDQMVKKVPMENKDFDELFIHADPFILNYVRTGHEEHSGLLYAITAITVFVILVTLLPTVNLMNINVTRIMERSSEIGVRKAFGASSRTLVYQFIVENLILTGLGGLIGLIFSFIIIHVLNHAELIDNLELTLSPSVLFYSLLACIFFGLLSGVYPAWRMSRLNVVTALKA